MNNMKKFKIGIILLFFVQTVFGQVSCVDTVYYPHSKMTAFGEYELMRETSGGTKGISFIGAIKYLEEKNILHDKKGGIEILIRESDSVAESQSYIGGKQGLVLGVIDKREANPFSYILEFSNNPNRGTLNRIEQHGKSPIYFAGMEETFFHLFWIVLNG